MIVDLGQNNKFSVPSLTRSTCLWYALSRNSNTDHKARMAPAIILASNDHGILWIGGHNGCLERWYASDRVRQMRYDARKSKQRWCDTAGWPRGLARHSMIELMIRVIWHQTKSALLFRWISITRRPIRAVQPSLITMQKRYILLPLSPSPFPLKGSKDWNLLEARGVWQGFLDLFNSYTISLVHEELHISPWLYIIIWGPISGEV